MSKLKETLIFLAALAIIANISISITLGKSPPPVPAQDYTIWGRVYIGDTVLTRNSAGYVISLEVNSTELVSYELGSDSLNGDFYVLKVPMTAGGIMTGRARAGDSAYIFINNKAIVGASLASTYQAINLPITIGNPAETVEINISGASANTPPVASNPAISPSSPLTTDDLVCNYDYCDADGDTESGTTIRWYKGTSLQSAYNDQKIIPSIATAKGQQWRFTVRPGDGTELGRYQTSPTVTIGNSAPSAENPIITLSPDGSLVAEYTYTDADEDNEVGTEIRWYRNDELQSSYNNQTIVPSGEIAIGQKWRFTVKPKDGFVFGSIQLSDAITIGNSLPMAINVSISPASPLAADDLTGVYEYIDANGDTENGTEIKWYKNSELQALYNNQTRIPSSETLKGQKWYFTVKPNDGIDFGIIQISNTVTIGNTPPSSSDLDISPAQPTSADELVCVYKYNDLDGDDESGTEIKWYKDGVYNSYYKNRNILPSTATKKGQTWYYTIRPNDGTDFGAIQTSPAVTIGNSPPIASDVAISPTAPTTSDNLACNYDYNDADNDIENGSEIRWYRDGELQTAYNDQAVIPFDETSKGQKWHYTVTPKDGEVFGQIQMSAKVVIGNTKPVVSNSAISPIEPLTTDDLTCNYDYYDADGDAENGTTIRWYKGSSLQSDYNDQRTIPSDATAKGQEWRFTVRPRDGFEQGKYQTSPTVVISNTPPSAGDLIISISAEGNLTAGYTYIDDDNDVEDGTKLRWYKDTVLQTAYNDQTMIPSSETLKGQKWHFTVEPKDGEDYGEAKTSDIITIGNVPPVASDLCLTPEKPLTTDSLKCAYKYYDANGDAEAGTEIRWYKDDRLQAEYNDLTGVPADGTSKVEKWYFTVKPKDGTIFGIMKTSTEIIIGNSPPSASDLNIALSQDGGLIVEYVYADVDNDAENGTEISWFRDGKLLEKFDNRKTIPSDSLTKGEKWHFTVKPKDGTDFGEIQTSPTITIGNNPPTASDLKISPASPLTANDLECSYIYDDTEGDIEKGTQVRWYRDGELQSAYNDQLIVPSGETSKGQKWHFTVKPKDGSDFGMIQASLEVVIGNTPPTANNLYISPESPVKADDLTCGYNYSDADGDAESGTEIRWYKNGKLQTKYNDQLTLLSDEIKRGDKWYFTIKPKDGEDFGAIQTSPEVTVSNSPPSAGDIHIAVSPKFSLTAEYKYADIDGDTEKGTEIRWYNDGELLTAYNDYVIIPSDETSKGEKWYITVRPKDGTDFGEIQSSDEVTIGNIQPTAGNIVISPSSPMTTDDLKCSYDYSDADGDAESGTEIRWYKNGELQTAYNNHIILPSSETRKGDSLYFTVKPKDGINFGLIQVSVTVNIGNSTPMAEELKISPTSPLTMDDLTCSYVYGDADGDAENGTEIRWYKNSELQIAYNDQLIVPSGETSKGQKWHFTVKPKDGEDFGAIQTSSVPVISNSLPTASDLIISPASPLTADDLMCSYSYEDRDNDPENGTEISWYKNDILQPLYNDKLTVPSRETSKGEEWYFTVRPKDGEGFGAVQTSDVVRIGDTKPTAGELVVSISPAGDLIAEYTYSDADGDIENGTEIRWYKDGQAQKVYHDQAVVPSKETLKGEKWHFTVRPKNSVGSGSLQTSSPITIGNIPPVADDLHIELFPEGDLMAKYTYSDADGDAEGDTVIRWYRNGGLQAKYDGQLKVLSKATSKGEKWHFTVKPNDGTDFGATRISDPITIGNTPPIASNAVIVPASPLTADDLTCSYDYYDADGDTENGTEIRWYKNGRLEEVYNNRSSIPSRFTSKGDKWYFTVKPKDGENFGTIRASADVTIGNTPPMASNAVILPPSPMTVDDLICYYDYYDADQDSENGTEIRWYEGDRPMLSYNDQCIVPADATSKGQRWHFVVRPKDGADAGENLKSPIVTIANTPPMADDLNIGVLSNGALTAEYKYSDTDDDIENGTEIRWYSNGNLRSLYDDQTDIPSGVALARERWHFTVKPKDGMDFGDIKTSSVITIGDGRTPDEGNEPPSANNLNIIPLRPLTTENLRCSYNYTDADGDAESGTEIRWYRDGELQTAYNDQVAVSAVETAKGQGWYFTVKPRDGREFGSIQTSPVITIANAPPEANYLSIMPLLPLTSDDLVCSYYYSDIDSDTENGTEIKWYKEGELQALYNDKTILPSKATSKGEVWHFTVKPSDGIDYGKLKASDSVIIGNSAPVIADLSLTPSFPLTLDDLTCKYSYTDEDGDPESHAEVRWYKDGVLQEPFNDMLILPPSATCKGQEWYCMIRVCDGDCYSQQRKSAHVNVINTPPTADIQVATEKDSMLIGALVEFRGSGSSDPDGDPLSYRWDFDASDGISVDSSQQNPSHAFTTAGTYLVTLTVGDGESVSKTASMEIRIEEELRLLSATYDIPSTRLTLSFNKPVRADMIRFDRIGMEVNNSGNMDFSLADLREIGVNQIQSYDMEIKMGDSTSTAFGLTFAGVVKHHRVDLVMKQGAFTDIYGVKSSPVLGTDDIAIQMMSNGFILGTIGDVNGNGLVTDYDAMLVLQAVVKGVHVLPIYDAGMDVSRWLAKYEYSNDVVMDIADVDGSGDISSYDASLIMQKASGIINDFPQAVPTTNIPCKKSVLRIVRYNDLGVDVAIELDDVRGVYSADMVIVYDPQVLKLDKVSRSYTTSKWLFEQETAESGKLKVSLAGISQPIADGPIVNLSFDVISQDTLKGLKIAELKINGGRLDASVENLPDHFALLQNYPNPFNLGTWIPYRLNEAVEVSITIYNINGQAVRQLNLGVKMPGNYTDRSRSVYWDGRNEAGEKVSCGVYFYHLKAGRNVSVRKMVIVE